MRGGVLRATMAPLALTCSFAMKHFPINYVQAHRERAGFSHEELADLIGQNSATSIGHFESGARVPTLEGGLALQLIFGERLQTLFESFYHHVEESVVARAHALYEKLEGRTDPLSLAKRAALEAIPKRAIGNPDAV